MHNDLDPYKSYCRNCLANYEVPIPLVPVRTILYSLGGVIPSFPIWLGNEGDGIVYQTQLYAVVDEIQKCNTCYTEYRRKRNAAISLYSYNNDSVYGYNFAKLAQEDVEKVLRMDDASKLTTIQRILDNGGHCRDVNITAYVFAYW